MTITYAYAADISKFEKTESGDLLVDGIATDTTKDLDGQRCDPDWLKEAMPGWFEWGNIRDQHSSRAAGVAQKMDALPGDAWWVQTLVTDPVAIHKVETKTYKGYSIGIRDALLKTVDGQEWICGGKIVEVSLVDRPCNPTAKLALAKSITPGASVTVRPGSEIDPGRMLIKCAEVIDLPENALLPGDHWVTVTDVTAKAADQPAEKEIPRKDGPPAVDKLADLHRTIAHLNKLAEGIDADQAAPVPAIRTVADLATIVQGFDKTAKPSREVLAAHVKTVGTRLKLTDLTKATHDAAQLGDIRDGLVACICAELAELCQGERELCDVEELLCSLRYFMCWWSGEAWEGETDGPYDDDDSLDVMWLSAKEATVGDQTGNAATDTAAATTAQPATPDPAGAQPAGQATRKSITNVELSDLIKNAVTEATKASEDRLKAVEAQLAKVQGAPKAGGPVLSAPATTTNQKTADLAKFEKLAEATADPDMRFYYRAKASQLRKAMEAVS